LTNEAESANAAADAMADSDLEKGRILLAEGKNADELLKGLVKKYPENYFLALHVAKLLLENRRREAAKQILQPLWEPSVLDAQKHNLLGVAYLDDDPSMAVREFYVAYGRDLNYSAALLNLAQAYEANQRTADAEKCLRYFLRRFPGDAHAADARQRLAVLEK
jgi:thioredoxin-like negative regulator of GroEL